MINTFTLPLVEYFGNNASAWTKTFCVFGVIAIIAFLFTFFGTKERVGAAESAVDEVPFKEGVKALFKNKYWMMMTRMLALLYPFLSLRSGTKRYENVSLSSFFLYNSSCRELGILQITGR